MFVVPFCSFPAPNENSWGGVKVMSPLSGPVFLVRLKVIDSKARNQGLDDCKFIKEVHDLPV